jgi:hypothetical protein
MKKAFGIIALLATSMGVLTLPAAARDRDDGRYAKHREARHDRDRDRDWNHHDRRDVRYRGYSRDRR